MTSTEEWLRSINWSGGFDRNGSHSEGKYSEYECEFSDYLGDFEMSLLAEEIDKLLEGRLDGKS